MTESTSSTSSSDPQSKDSQLAALLKEAEAGQPAAQASPLPQKPVEEPVPEVYRTIVKPLAIGMSWGIDKINRKYLGCEFARMTDEQIGLIKDDAAFVIREAVDSFMPQFAKDHPRLTALVLSLGTIYAANTRKLPPKEPVGSTGADGKKPAAPVTGSPSESPTRPVPDVHEVVITAEGTIGQGGVA